LDCIDAVLKEQRATLEKVFLTHSHIDHCGQSRQFSQFHAVPLEGPHIADKFWIDQLPEQGKL
jgi:hydroxyacylglutathione hydrolase